MKKQTCCTPFWAMMCHLSTFLGFILPGLSILAPLLIWGLKRDEDPLIRENGRNVINFILSFWLYSFALLSAFALFFFLAFALLFFLAVIQISPIASNYMGGFFSTGVIVFYAVCGIVYGLIYIVFHLILPIYGGLKAFNREIYRYPLTISFLKGNQSIEGGCKPSAK